MRIALRIAGKAAPEFSNAKVFTTGLKSGDAFAVNSGGGGGFGSPLEHPVDRVRHDVVQGYVSLEAAKDLYGVVLDPEMLEVDVAATEHLRTTMAASNELPSRRRMSAGHRPILKNFTVLKDF